MMLNGGLWRVCFGDVRKLLILERETGIEPASGRCNVLQCVTDHLFSTIFNVP